MTNTSKTPRTDREVYTVSAADIGFEVVNPALCRHLEERAERMRQHILRKVVGRLCEPVTGRVAGWGCGLCGAEGKGPSSGIWDPDAIEHEADCMVAALANNPNPSGPVTPEASVTLGAEASVPVGLGPQNDGPTLERAIEYCRGQRKLDPTYDPAYDRGVAACVRMLEDMLPAPDPAITVKSGPSLQTMLATLEDNAVARLVRRVERDSAYECSWTTTGKSCPFPTPGAVCQDRQCWALGEKPCRRWDAGERPSPISRYHQPCAKHQGMAVTATLTVSTAIPSCFLCYPEAPVSGVTRSEPKP